VWRKWAVEHGLNPEYVVRNAHGRRSIETIRQVAPQLDADKENEIVEGMEIEDKDGVVAIAGARRLLLSLPSKRFTIVTSATRPLAETRLEYAGVPVPKRFITADDVVNGKPSPEPYMKGAELLGIPAQDCIVFEDTPAGVQSGKSAGCRVIAVSSTYSNQKLTAAETIITTLEDVSVRENHDELQIETR